MPDVSPHEPVTERPEDHDRPDVAEGARARELARRPDAREHGRLAWSPWQMPWRGWLSVLRRTLHQMISDRVSLVAAGCAFYAMLAMFPAISMLISVYGLVFDPRTVEPQLAVLAHFLPAAGYHLIADRVHVLVTKQPGTLGINLVISFVITFWSSGSGTKSLLAALNMAYEETEQRTFLRFQLVAFAMTLAAILGAALAVALVVALPAALNFFGVSAHQKFLINAGSTAVLVLFVLTSLALVYRYGPCRKRARWHWITPGSLVATVLWLAASLLFSWYVSTLSNFDATYGSIGAVVGVMMWFWVSAYAVLLGAELNSELELQTARDSTAGTPKPIGRRGAYVADHVAED